MTLAIFFPLFMIACAIIIIALMDNPWIRLIWACLIVGGTLTLARSLPLPGTEATQRDVIKLIDECESTIPRNQKCVIDIGLRVDDGTTDYE
jgi:hypothetical protein